MNIFMRLPAHRSIEKGTEDLPNVNLVCGKDVLQPCRLTLAKV